MTAYQRQSLPWLPYHYQRVDQAARPVRPTLNTSDRQFHCGPVCVRLCVPYQTLATQQFPTLLGRSRVPYRAPLFLTSPLLGLPANIWSLRSSPSESAGRIVRRDYGCSSRLDFRCLGEPIQLWSLRTRRYPPATQHISVRNDQSCFWCGPHARHDVILLPCDWMHENCR